MSVNSVATVETFELAQRQARAFAASALVPETLKGSTENCLAAIMIADEMAESRIAVMQSIYFVGGRAAFLAQYMVSRVNRSGKFRGPLRWKTEGQGETLAVTCYADLAEIEDRVEVTVSMAMAKAEGWTRNKKYETIPEQMLRWRSATWLIRLYAPEVMMGLPTKEELEDISPDMIDVTPPMPKLSDFAPPVKGKAKEQNPADPPAGALSGPAEAPQAAGAGERTRNLAEVELL
jgi:hypothetical protein